MTVLLTVFTMINFLDKIVLGMVAVPLMAELHLTPSEFGLVAGSFYWLFSFSAIVVGFVSNRVAARWLLLAMGLLWATFQLPLIFAGSALTLMICRVLLGAAEGPASPVALHAIYKWFPDERRTLPGTIVMQGAVLGLVLAGLMIPQVTRIWGWRANFVVLATIGLAWAMLWLALGREGPLDSHKASERGASPAATHRVPYRKLLTNPSVLSLFVVGFFSMWTVGVSMTWLPAYLEQGLALPAVTAGRLVSVVMLVPAPVCLVAGWFSERLLRRGATGRTARVMPMVVALAIGGILTLGVTSPHFSPLQKAMLLAVANAMPSLTLVLTPPLIASIVPAAQRGAVLSIYLALANFASAIAPLVMGHFIQSRGAGSAQGYEAGFLPGATLMLAGAVTAWFLLRPDNASRTFEAIAAPAR